MTAQEKEWIDKASTEQLLGKWRFAPVGDEYFQDAERVAYFQKAMQEKRSADPAGWTRASKNLGW